MVNKKKKISIGLVQINNSFSNQNYLPYSVGLLQAYIEGNAKDINAFEFILPIYKRMAIDKAVEHLRDSDVIGFSTYVWNVRISLEIAKRVKQIRPECVIVFGGPQVPDKAEKFLADYPFIDLCCHGEGEQVFLDLLEGLVDKGWEEVPSISYVDNQGDFVNNPKNARIKDLSVLPSPFLHGTFDALLEANPNEQWLALWETNRGCPFSCTFCDWGSATASKLNKFEMDRLLKEVDWFASKKIEFIFCCDANFGILPRDVEIAQHVAGSKQKVGYPHALSVQNTKNATERAYQTQKILNDAGLNKGVTIALQTVDEYTLKSIKRGNISSDTYQELQRRFTKDGVETYTDVILGLPGETYDTFVDGIAHIIDNGQHNRIQFNNLSILPNAEMGNPDYQKQYGMVIVETKTINVHGALDESDEEIAEYQELVIATNTMPKEDWARTRSFSWMVAFLHFDKVLQIPIVLLNEVCSIPYRELFECLFVENAVKYPVLSEIQGFFRDKAVDIQDGGSEYCESREWLNIWWPADEYMLIRLCKENKLNDFYLEVEQVLAAYLIQKNIEFPADLLHDAITLNKSMIKLPQQTENLELHLSYNIWEYYRSVIASNPILLEQVGNDYYIDRTSLIWNTWDDWYKEVIWYGNKKGAYLYGNEIANREIAGHF
jgi:radical SAM superfamily enzyme YgiQ (UPF0313 family)